MRFSLRTLTTIAALVAALAAHSQKAIRSDLAFLGDSIKFNLLQINDVYEITPVGGEGGMAKLATLLNAYKLTNPNTFLVLAGDFFSPSALGTARVDGERLAGKQMVSVLNALPLNVTTFGNHEFDVSEPQFHQRLGESLFDYVASNVTGANGAPFEKVAANKIQVVTDGTRSVRVGYFGLTIPSNPKAYVQYADVMKSAEAQVRELRPKVDVLVALTHLGFEDDIKLAETFPEIDLIVGGHEHEHHRIEIASLPGIYKADANARTVYVHEFAFDPMTRRLGMRHHLAKLTADVLEDPKVRAEVDKWVAIAYEGFRKDGFEPTAKVANVPVPLDGREAAVRNGSSDLTALIANGMLAAVPGADAAIYNGGSIRIDDVILPGELTEYDVIRILPFGGKIVEIQTSGAFLKKVLDQGIANRGEGGFLQWAKIEPDAGNWKIGGAALDPGKTYTIAISDFLLTGNETGLGFLKRDAPEVKVVREHADIRNATIAEFKRAYPAKMAA